MAASDRLYDDSDVDIDALLLPEEEYEEVKKSKMKIPYIITTKPNQTPSIKPAPIS